MSSSISNGLERLDASVLIIDDDAGTLSTYSTILRLAGFQVITAATGMAGLGLAAVRAFNVVLVDLNLPDLSGLDVVRKLKGQLGVISRVVIITGFPSFESSFDAAAAAADGYIDGPLWGDDIVDLVSAALSGPVPIRHPRRRTAAEADSGPPTRRDGIASIDPRIGDVMRLVNANLTKPWSLSQLAKRVGLSESGLSHLFQTCVGVSLRKFRNERRLQTAAGLLATTHEDIGRIAYSVGFRSESLRDFRRAFRERFKLTPSAYRTRFWRGNVSDAQAAHRNPARDKREF